MTDPREDMWYLEGQWRPVPGSHTDTFLVRAETLDPSEIIAGTQRGLMVALHDDAKPGAESTMAMVITQPNQTICVRRIFDAKAIEIAKSWERDEM